MRDAGSDRARRREARCGLKFLITIIELLAQPGDALFARFQQVSRSVRCPRELDIRRDVLAHMEFTPRMASPVKTMDARLFRTGIMGIGEEWRSQRARPAIQTHQEK